MMKNISVAWTNVNASKVAMPAPKPADAIAQAPSSWLSGPRVRRAVRIMRATDPQMKTRTQSTPSTPMETSEFMYWSSKMIGTVSAKAIYSFVTPSRFKPSAFPVIQVQANAAGPKAAKKLAQQTTAAFTSWLVANQNASHVPQSERILVQELQAPGHAAVTGRAKKSLPLAIGALVLCAFLGLAILLDRLNPRAAASARPQAAVPA